MEKFLALIEENLNIDLVSIIISNPRQAGEIMKMKIRPVLIKEQLYYQVESFTKKQAFHKNLKKKELITVMKDYVQQYKQIQMLTKTKTIHGLISKKGKVTVKIKNIGGKQKTLSHNRKKTIYIRRRKESQFFD